jgi:hypothetical protein
VKTKLNDKTQKIQIKNITGKITFLIEPENRNKESPRNIVVFGRVKATLPKEIKSTQN